MPDKKKKNKKQTKIRDLKPQKDTKGGMKYGIQGSRPYGDAIEIKQ